MKKTLITLAALAAASVASAATHEDAAANLVNPTQGAATSVSGLIAGDYTVVMVMDSSKLDSLPGWNDGVSDGGFSSSWTSITFGGSGTSNMWWAQGIKLFKGGDGWAAALTLDGTRQYPSENPVGSPYRKDDDTASIYMNNSNIVDGKVVLTFSSQKVESGYTFTLGVLEGDETVSTGSWTMNEDTWKNSDGTAKEMWNVNLAIDAFKIENAPDGLVEHMLFFQGALSNAELAEAVNDVVPEPATATLSLLALAGLAARRRRK